MKLAHFPNHTIHDCTISDLSVLNGRKTPAQDFHVFKSEEFIHNNKFIHHPVRSDHYVLLLILAGGIQLQQSLINYQLTPNSLFIISPNTVHQNQQVQEGTQLMGMAFSRNYLTQSGLHIKHMEAFNYYSTQSNPHLALDEQEVHTLHLLLLLLREKDLLEEEYPFKTETMHHAFNLLLFELAAIFKKKGGHQHLRMTRKEEHLMGFLRLLSAHFKEERSVQYYADALFVTPKHLTKTVKEITSKTSGELIDEMVITEAKILLDNPAWSVGKVAEELHFSDQFFFSKFFKNHTGLSPSEYKSTL